MNFLVFIAKWSVKAQPNPQTPNFQNTFPPRFPTIIDAIVDPKPKTKTIIASLTNLAVTQW
jgi:hypothetical protein